MNEMGAISAMSEPEAVAPISANDTPQIYALARNCLDDVGGDVKAATARLNDMLMEDEELRLVVFEDVVRLAVYRAVDNGVQKQRRKVWGEPVDGAKAVAALASGVFNSLYDFPLAGGIKLGDATRDQVKMQADSYGTLIADMSVKRKFLASIAENLPAKKTVREAFTEEQLRDLKRQALK